MCLKKIITILISISFAINSYCQSFVNGDLDGPFPGPNSLPTDWQNVPYMDVNCLALQTGGDTPDLTSANSQYPVGNPYHGLTFLSGLFGTQNNGNNFWQEGIMQAVSGFTIENSYTIRFHQTVVRNLDALDKSGSWAVYIDTVLAEITVPTYSNEPVGSLNQPWEARSITFTARNITHLIKFLPLDDDSNWIASTTDSLGALRMGIDSIGFVIPTSLNEQKVNGGFNLFPNPNNGTFSLLCPDNSNISLVIYDNKGTKVYDHFIKPSQSVLNIDLGNTSKGLYNLVITTEKTSQNIKFTIIN